MRKTNYPRLNLPSCQVSPISVERVLSGNKESRKENKDIRRILIRTRMPASNRPENYHIKLTQLSDELFVYDDLRQQWLLLTPEEWVRQHFVAYLIRDLGYPPSLMMNEVTLDCGSVNKRIDTVLYSTNQCLSSQPKMTMLIEYKATHIPLSNIVLEQIVRYNYIAHAPYLIISNGLEHQVYHIDYEAMSYRLCDEIPRYSDIKDL